MLFVGMGQSYSQQSPQMSQLPYTTPPQGVVTGQMVSGNVQISQELTTQLSKFTTTGQCLSQGQVCTDTLLGSDDPQAPAPTPGGTTPYQLMGHISTSAMPVISSSTESYQNQLLQLNNYSSDTRPFSIIPRQGGAVGTSFANTELIDPSAGAADIAMAMPQDLQAALQHQPHQQMALVRRHVVRQSSYKMAQQQPVMPPYAGGSIEDDFLLWGQAFPIATDQPPLSPMFEENGEELESNNIPECERNPFTFMDTTQ